MIYFSLISFSFHLWRGLSEGRESLHSWMDWWRRYTGTEHQ